ncbi:MAG: sigma-70 family RNA polymerase sigma factor [Planctomycetota bacterium]
MITRTTTRLLDELCAPGNERVWEEFDARYRPILEGVARKLGFGDEEAAEITQESLTTFLQAFRAGRYDRSKGRLSSWLVGITRNTAMAICRRGVIGGKHKAGGDTLVAGVPDEAQLTLIWDEQCEREVLRAAMAQLRATSRTDERTFLAFELVALRGATAEAAAQACGMSVAEVYVAKNRMTRRLKETITLLREAYREDG